MNKLIKEYARQFFKYNFFTGTYRVTGKDIERLILWVFDKENKEKLSKKDKNEIRNEINDINSFIRQIMMELGLKVYRNIIYDNNSNMIYDIKNFTVLNEINNNPNKRNISKKRKIRTFVLITGSYVLINIISPLMVANELANSYRLEVEDSGTENSSDSDFQNVIEATQKKATIVFEAIRKEEEEKAKESLEESQESETPKEQIDEVQPEETFEEQEENEQTKIYYDSPHDDFSAEIRRTIEEKKYELNSGNMKQILKNYNNSIIEYIRGFGGIFEKFAGKTKVVIKTAGDFQKFWEFIGAVLATLGPDYYNPSTNEYKHWGAQLNDEASRFYTEDKEEGVSDEDDITTALTKGIINMNCSSGLKLVLNSMVLEELDEPIKITKKEDLQPLDIIYFKLEKDSEEGINHVAVVGEIDEESGEVIIYDLGRRFQFEENYKMKLSKDYEKYNYWYAKRKYKIDPSTEITFDFLKDQGMSIEEEDR